MPEYVSVLIPKEKVNEERMLVTEVRDSGNKFLVWIPVDDEAKREVKKAYKDRNNPGSLSSKLREDWEKEQLKQEGDLTNELKSLREQINDSKDNGDPLSVVRGLEGKVVQIQNKLGVIQATKRSAQAVKWAMGEKEEVLMAVSSAEDKKKQAIAEALGEDIKVEEPVKRKAGRPKKQ